jgi:hypothetical protein
MPPLLVIEPSFGQGGGHTTSTPSSTTTERARACGLCRQAHNACDPYVCPPPSTPATLVRSSSVQGARQV